MRREIQRRGAAGARNSADGHPAPTVRAVHHAQIRMVARAGGEFARQPPAALGAVPVSPTLTGDLGAAHSPQIR